MRPAPAAEARPPVRVAVLGGGNGISAVLEGLVGCLEEGGRGRITAIVATADDGGSSGRLREQRGDLPWGDLRRCLLALSAGSAAQPWYRLFEHRYGGKGELAGHALGNLILSALAEREGCPLKALRCAERMLACRGHVLPATAVALRLEAETFDGRRLLGESRIGRAPSAIREVSLRPEAAPACPGVLSALESADLVVIGPGSLFTSLLPVLLVQGIASTLRQNRCPKVLVANLMTQPGETVGMSLEDHLDALDRHLGPGLVTHVLADDSIIEADRLAAYRQQGAEPLERRLPWRRRERLVFANLATRSGKIRHEPGALASALLSLCGKSRPEVKAVRSKKDRVQEALGP